MLRHRRGSRARNNRISRGEPLEARALLTVAPEMLANVGYAEYSNLWSEPDEFVQLGPWTLFAASSQEGRELWRSDGTPAGTQLVANSDGFPNSLYPQQLTRLGDLVFFVGGDASGYELWQTDGSTTGTKRVSNLNTAPFGSSSPQELTPWGSRLAFTAENEQRGRELYVYDPATSKSSLVADLLPGALGSVPSGLTVFGDKLVFVADDGVHGRELWTASADNSTQLLQEIRPGAAHAFPTTLGDAPFAAVGDWVYFSADDGMHGTELWRTNGLPGGANLVVDVYEGDSPSTPRSLTPVQGGLAFRANDGLRGTELWFTTGDAAGTRFVADICPGPETSAGRELVVSGSSVYFFADDGQHGLELWTSDLSTAGTRLVADIQLGYEGSRPEQLLAWNDGLYFVAETADLGRELWRSNGTTAGTAAVVDLYPGAANGVELLVQVGDRLWLSANNGFVGQEPWIVTSAQPAPTLVRDIAKRQEQSGHVTDGFVAAGGHVYFTAFGSDTGGELWRTDGTPESTSILDFVPGRQGLDPEALIEYQGWLYFTASTPESGRELWRTNGTLAGTELVADLEHGANGSLPRELTVANGQLFFVAEVAGRSELWRVDLRTDPAASPERAFVHPTAPSRIDQLANSGERLFFTVNTLEYGFELWTTEGAAASTARGPDFALGPPGAYLRLLGASGADFYLMQETPAGGSLWRTDLLGGSATLLVDAGDPLQPRINVGSASALLVGDELYFTAAGFEQGVELWRIGNAAESLTLVSDINPGPAGSRPHELTQVGDVLYFVAEDGVHGPAIWSTDGSPAGTRFVVDVDPAESLDPPRQLEAVGDWLYFAATDLSLGVELWRTDGTSASTQRVADLWPGQGASYPDHLDYLHGTLYFSARRPGLAQMPFGLRYAEPLPGDANFDGRVDLSDFGILKSAFGQAGSHEDGDFNGDRQVDLTDFGILKKNFGEVWQVEPVAAGVAADEVLSTPIDAASPLAAAAWSLAADALFADLDSELDRLCEETS